MKVSTENDNNFGYEKITILVDNIPLSVLQNIVVSFLTWRWSFPIKLCARCTRGLKITTVHIFYQHVKAYPFINSKFEHYNGDYPSYMQFWWPFHILVWYYVQIKHTVIDIVSCWIKLQCIKLSLLWKWRSCMCL